MGNWKCHKSIAEARAFVRDFQLTERQRAACRVALFPPFLAIPAMAEAIRGSAELLELGAQDVSASPNGAHTGEVSAEMLAELGLGYALVGHSERRRDQQESGALLAAKLKACLRAGLTPVFCIGETLAERQAQRTDHVLAEQLRAGLGELDAVERQRRIVVAYEPVWAIGSGLSAGAEQLVDAARAIRRALATLLPDAEAVALLYGGSVKSSNAGEIMSLPGYQGLLVGGASLDPIHFADIVAASSPS